VIAIVSFRINRKKSTIQKNGEKTINWPKILLFCHENLEPVRFPSPFCQGYHFRQSLGNPPLPAIQWQPIQKPVLFLQQFADEMTLREVRFYHHTIRRW